MLTPDELGLRWPVDLFTFEVGALLTDPDAESWKERAALLMAEAFVGEAAIRGLYDAERRYRAGSRDRMADGFDVACQMRYLQELVNLLRSTPPPPPPRPYFAERRGAPLSEEPSAEQRHHRLRAEWVDLVGWFEGRGYLEQVRDRHERPEGGREDLMAALDYEALRRLGVPRLWPLRPQGWTEDLFYNLIEVVHDMVARPRLSFQHEEMREPHYEAFSRSAGQRLYRWRVNQLLERYAEPLRLADDGEDVGHLVDLVDDGRADLVQRVLCSPAAADGVAHAVALFRVREATVDQKRSAIVALARILEGHRALLKADLLSGDESDLREVANKFDLRHKRADQKTDYDPAFLDWIFWWYLATVELTNRLLERRSPS